MLGSGNRATVKGLHLRHGYSSWTGPRTAGAIAAGFKGTDPLFLARRRKLACSASSAEVSCFTHVVAGNGFDRVSAGLRTGIGGKTGKERGSSGQCVGFGEDSGVFGVKKGTQLRSNAAGLDAKGRLFVLIPNARLVAI